MKEKPNIDQDIDIVKEYFKNLDSVNLRNVKYLSIKEIVPIYIDNKQDKIMSTKRSYKGKSEFTLLSNSGYIMMYDLNDEYLIKFTDLSLRSRSEDCITQNEYVIFEYDSVNLKLSFEGLVHDHPNYKC